VANPVAFLEFDDVFAPEVQESLRFRSEFATAYRRIAEDGPIAAMQAESDRGHAER
jgi:hypothetical protein